MKTIKEFEYKGHKVTVKAKFKENTKEYVYKHVFYDSVLVELTVRKDWRLIFQDGTTIEKEREDRVGLQSSMFESVDSLVFKAKEKIDKLVREEEITNGLPESLLGKEPKDEVNEQPSEEIVIEVKMNLDMGFNKLMYEIANKAIEDRQKESIEKFASALSKNLEHAKVKR